MKDDLGKENPKWKFVAGQWTRRPSGGRPVLAQVAETQPWAVAILEDQKFDDIDVTVRFRPISGKEDAERRGSSSARRTERNYLLVRANALENNFRLYTIVNGKRSTIASARVTEPTLGEWHRIRVVRQRAEDPGVPGRLPSSSTTRRRPSRAAGSGSGPRRTP